MRVLIVEDEPYLAEAVRDGLRLEANAADIAGDGDTALEMPRLSPCSPTARSSIPDRAFCGTDLTSEIHALVRPVRG